MNAPAFWTRRSPGERTVMAAVVAVVVLALGYAFAWLPMERHRERLAAELPALRASVAGMRAQAADVKRLKAMPARSAASPVPLASLLSAGTLAQGLPGAKLSAVDGKRVRLTVEDVPWARLVEWIAGAQSLHGLAAESATVEALAVPGRVRADLVLVAP